MTTKWFAVTLLLLSAACAPKRVAAPPAAPAPPARQNVFALLPEPNGESSGIVVRNQAGAQDLTQPYQAVRVQAATVAPSAPVVLDQPEVRRLFGAAIDVMPELEILFVLHFDENRDVLNTESQAQIPTILQAIRDRHSTAITVTGHTDTTATPQYNYELGLRRARNVKSLLEAQGVNADDVFALSHGDADLLVKTDRNKPNEQNRRVEVIVR
jgi:peptidoglycan-associated lipoprotein